MASKKTKVTEAPSPPAKSAPQSGGKPIIGVKLSVLRSLMDEIDGNPKLQKVFGKPVCEKIGIAAIGNNIQFMELPTVKLSGEDKGTYLTEMNAIMRKRFGRK